MEIVAQQSRSIHLRAGVIQTSYQLGHSEESGI